MYHPVQFKGKKMDIDVLLDYLNSEIMKWLNREQLSKKTDDIVFSHTVVKILLRCKIDLQSLKEDK